MSSQLKIVSYLQHVTYLIKLLNETSQNNEFRVFE